MVGRAPRRVVSGTEGPTDCRSRTEHVEESRRHRVSHDTERLSRARHVQLPPVDRSEQFDRGEVLLTGKPCALIL
jgi:hypothetical protein